MPLVPAQKAKAKSAECVPAQRLDLDDRGAELGQHHGAECARDVAGEVEHHHPLERSPSSRRGLSPPFIIHRSAFCIFLHCLGMLAQQRSRTLDRARSAGQLDRDAHLDSVAQLRVVNLHPATGLCLTCENSMNS